MPPGASSPPPPRPRRNGSAKTAGAPARVSLGMLAALGASQLVAYLAVRRLSTRFVYGLGHQERPILIVLALLGAATFSYLVSLWLIVRQGPGVGGQGSGGGRRNAGTGQRPEPFTLKPRLSTLNLLILSFAIAFRAALLFSRPIQEVDVYRYLWDGRVLAAGHNPYRYSPAQVDGARRQGSGVRGQGDAEMRGRGNAGTEGDGLSTLDSRLSSLAGLSRSSPAVSTIFERVHYREVPTVYPPAAQVFFALAASITPADAPLEVHLRVIRGLLIACDIATVLFLMGIFRRMGKPAAWASVYAWCPLAVKEVANSGHIDALAVMLCCAAWYLMIGNRGSGVGSRGGVQGSGFTVRKGESPRPRVAASPAHADSRRSSLVARLSTLTPAVLWGLAILAKLYPLVLLPVFARFWWGRMRWGTLLPLGVAAGVVASGYLPPALGQHRASSDEGREGAHADLSSPLTGLEAYATRWEMNDLAFALVVEQLTPPRVDPLAQAAAGRSRLPGETETAPADVIPAQAGFALSYRPDPWFVLLPRQTRVEAAPTLASLADSLGISVHPSRAPFVFTSVLVGGVVLAICLILALRRWPSDDRVGLLRASFLSLAWLWMLGPVQNPWYWLWALPLVLFARQRAWLLVSGFALLYYLRFWLAYHYAHDTVFGTPYRGTEFFDYVVVWIEHAPVFVLLLLEWLRRRNDKEC